MNTMGEASVWQPHACQCCLTQGCYKELSTEYFFMGEKEIYEEMLFTVFNITLTSEPSERRICEACIQKLRDGCSFKRQVLRSQHTLLQRGPSDTAKAETDVLESDVKLELEFHDGDGIFDDDALYMDASPGSGVKLEVSMLPEVKSATTAVKAAKSREKKPKGIKGERKVKAEHSQTPQVQQKTKTPPVNQITKKPPRTKQQFQRERNMKIDTTHIIRNSNLCAFKWHTNKYQCFCCKATFTDMGDLKAHTAQHTWAEINNQILRNNVVQYHKVEITDLTCTLCSESQENICILKAHLTQHHQITFREDKDLLIPFIIKKDTFQCAECEKSFVAFPSLNIHMNKHFQNHICDTCGASFIHVSNLREHLHRHENKSYTCDKCNTEFDSLYKRQLHEASVHNNGNRVCPHCPEKFNCHYKRLLHLIKFHGYKKPEFKCQSCDRVFLRQYLLNSHVRKFHMREKSHGCELCQAKFFTRYDLKQHAGTHGGTAAHCCGVCGKTYARRSSLKCHMKVHSAGKRKLKLNKKSTDPEKGVNIEVDTKKKESHMKNTTLELVLNSNLTLFDWCKNKYRCFFCKEMFLETALLKEHSKSHEEEEMQLKIYKYNVKYYYRAEISNLQCKNCPTLAENLSELTQHLSTSHSIKFKTQDSLLMPYKLTDLTCQLCKQEFQSFVVLDHHMTSHYSKYVCDTCGKGFRQKYCLRSHLVTHVKKLFTCKTCNLTFDNYYRKRKHDVSEHDVSDKFNSCPHCPEKFIHYAGRLKHLIKTHGYKRPEFKCNNCDKVYLNNALLRSHVRNVHLQERNFECNICQNKYLWKCELTDHMKSHIQARDFVCTYCGKGFYRRRNLNEHLAIHVEEFRHTCSVCGKTFAQKYNMKMHMRRCQDTKKK